MCVCVCVQGQSHPPAGWRGEPQNGCGVGSNEVLDNALLHVDVASLVAHFNCVVHVHAHIHCVQSVGNSGGVHTQAVTGSPDHSLHRLEQQRQLTWGTAGC